MAIYQRGSVWHYDFWFDGQRYRGSTKQRDRQAAQAVSTAKEIEVRRVAANIPVGQEALVRELQRRNRQLGALSSHSTIYFVSDGQSVKIGRSNKVRQRLAGLQAANSTRLVLLGTCAGSGAHEGLLHQWCAHLRHKGEWFRLTPELKAFIKALVAINRSRRTHAASAPRAVRAR